MRLTRALISLTIFGVLLSSEALVFHSSAAVSLSHPILINPQGPTAQSGLSEEVEKVNNLVVMIEYRLDESKPDSGVDFGAGIIFGFGNDALYILTAHHVVRAAAEQRRQVHVKFNWMRDTQVSATVERNADRSLDLAIVKVEGLNRIKVDIAALPFERLGNTEALAVRNELYSIGYPNLSDWRINAIPHTLAKKAKDRLYFEAVSISNGNSGGPLLNKNSEIVGMVSSDEPPEYWAINMHTILARVNQWGYPVALGKSNTPFPGPFILVTGCDDRTCALTENGKIYCWGVREETIRKDRSGRILGVEKTFDSEPLLDDKASKVALRFLTISSYGAALGIDIEGIPYFWGGCPPDESARNCDGTPVLLGGGVKLLTGGFNKTVAYGITTTHDTVSWTIGPNLPQTSPMSLGLKLQSISVGSNHTCGVSPSGEAFCWGRNGSGQLGNGTTQPSEVPVKVSGGLSFASIGVGDEFTCGLTKTGSVYCWGENRSGQLGRDPQQKPIKKGNKTNSTPGQVAGGLTFKALAVGGSHACALDLQGEAYCWGNDGGGRLGNVSARSNQGPTAVAGKHKFAAVAAWTRTCGWNDAGVVHCWGTYKDYNRVLGTELAVNEIGSLVPAPIENNVLRGSQYSIRASIFEGKFRQAHSSAEAAVKLFPDDERIKQDYLFLMADLGLTARAVTEAESRLANKTEVERALFLARLYLRGQNFNEAAKVLQDDRLTSSGSLEEVDLLRAAAFRGQNNFTRAEEVLRTLLQQQPDSAQALFALSYLLAEQNVRLDEALSLVQKAVKLDPGNDNFLASSGWIHYLQGNWQAAIEDLRTAWESVTRDPVVTEHLGDVYLRTGDTSAAVAYWQIALTEWQLTAPARQDAAAVVSIQQKIAANSQPRR